MKTENRSDYIIAFTVVACSIFLLGALTMALTGFRFQSPGQEIYIDFPSVAGIRVNSQLRYAGMPVGKITEMKWLTIEERSQSSLGAGNIIRATAKLNQNAPPLYEGTTASIISDTVLAEKFVDLDPVDIKSQKASSYKLLASNAVIQGNRVVGFDDLTRTGYEVMNDVNTILTQLKTQYPDLGERIGSLINHTENLAKNADELTARLEKILDKNDPRLSEIVNNLHVISQNLKVTTTYTKALTYTLGEKPWRVVWGATPNQLPSEKEILQSAGPIPFTPPDQENSSKDKSKKAR